MSRTGIARSRHLRHRLFDRFRRQDTIPNWWATVVTTLTGTGATTNFTATNATNQITSTAHGLNTGNGPFTLSNSGGALPNGLTTTDQYWVIYVDANTIQWSTAPGSLSAVAFSDDGTGTHSYALAAEDTRDIYAINKKHKPVRIDAETDVDNL
jgi:hypothetical protein